MAASYRTHRRKRRHKFATEANISLALLAFWLTVLLMRKPALAGFAFLVLNLPAGAQQMLGHDNLNSLSNGQLEFPALTLANTQPFFFPSTFNWIDPASAEFLPSLPSVATTRSTAAATRLPDSSKEFVDVTERNLLDSVHGEVGMLYGHSIGKFDREVEAGYIVGGVGDDKLQISVGGMYEHWSSSTAHFGRSSP
jgi:hypothetical protein